MCVLKGVCVQEIKTDKNGVQYCSKYLGMLHTAWEVLIMWEKVLAGFLAKDCRRWLSERVPGCITQMTIV